MNIKLIDELGTVANMNSFFSNIYAEYKESSENMTKYKQESEQLKTE